jgi:hypothetical protein
MPTSRGPNASSATARSRLSDVLTEACLAADREDGHRQPLRLALLVLSDGPIERGCALIGGG